MKQKIVLQVVSGSFYQAVGEFSEQELEELPAKLQEIGFTLIDGYGRPLKPGGKPEPPPARQTQKPKETGTGSD